MTDPEIAVTLSAPAWLETVPDAEERVRRVAVAALRQAADALDDIPPDRLEVSIVLTDDDEVRELNRQYRGRDSATNVLSFASLDDDEAPLPEEGPVLLGDIIVALQTTLREADDENKPVADHLSHLVVHGVLHLLGYDHLEEEDAEEMEALERTILAGLDIPDPYADAPPADAPKERDVTR